MDPVVARLVKKEDCEATAAKIILEEYRTYLILVGMGANEGWTMRGTPCSDTCYTTSPRTSSVYVLFMYRHKIILHTKQRHTPQYSKQIYDLVSVHKEHGLPQCGDFFGGFEPVIWPSNWFINHTIDSSCQ